MSTEKSTIQHAVCTCHFELLSKQNCIMAFCLIATSVILFYFPEISHATWQQSKWHVDGGWVFLSVRCWFLSVKWKIRFGRQLRCASYHNNLAPPSAAPLTPTPLVNSSRCGTVEWTKSLGRLIHRALRSDVKSPHPTPFCCHHHYLTLLPPLHPPIPTGCWGDRS